MKKTIVFCLLLANCSVLSHAQSIEKKLEITASAGYQQENLRWSISGDIKGQNPNILSELKWIKVGGQNASVSLSWKFYKRFVFYGDYSRQFITSGTVNDSDYSTDNRGAQTYNQTFDAGKGHTEYWDLGAGFIVFNHGSISLISYAGYGQSQEQLWLFGNNNQGLNSSYTPAWTGGFIKVVSAVKLTNKLIFKADVTYHQVNYNSDGNWNLVTTFRHPVSYHHHANGYGLQARGQINYYITRYIALHAGAGYFNWQTGNGTDELYLNSGQIDKTQLNGVKRNGFSAYGGLSAEW